MIVFDHVAIATASLADAAAILAGPLGGIPEYGADQPVFRFAQWSFAGGGRLEILEPRGEGGFVHRFLAQRGPGIHHVTFRVPDLRAICIHAERLGYGVVGFDDSRPLWKEAFLHPKQALGIVVQFAEAGSQDGEWPPHFWRAPGGPPEAPLPVTLLGLRCRARSREGVSRQWGQVLAGECVSDSGLELVYRWPGSPMRVAVEIDAAGEDGPVCLEYASARDVRLDGARAVLGAAFERCPR